MKRLVAGPILTSLLAILPFSTSCTKMQDTDLTAAEIANRPLQEDQSEKPVEKLCDGFVPPNNMNIPVGTFSAYGLSTQAQFNAILDRIQVVMGPIVAKRGGRLVIKRLWSDGTVNAYAERQGSNWLITMYGGMARHPSMNEEGFAIIACHEMGHHLGGAPVIPRQWASNEGESDYFATAKCMRYFYENADNEAWVRTGPRLDTLATNRCLQQFTTRAEQLLCMRTAYGAQALAGVLASLGGGRQPSFGTPDRTVVRSTNHNHPQAQCRLDTYFNGATCKVNKSVELSYSNTRTGACNQGTDQYGWRPLCWFRN